MKDLRSITAIKLYLNILHSNLNQIRTVTKICDYVHLSYKVCRKLTEQMGAEHRLSQNIAGVLPYRDFGIFIRIQLQPHIFHIQLIMDKHVQKVVRI